MKETRFIDYKGWRIRRHHARRWVLLNAPCAPTSTPTLRQAKAVIDKHVAAGKIPKGGLRVPVFHHGMIQSVKDVRSLRTCGLCNGLGKAPSMINVDKGHVHGRCYLTVHGKESLLALPKEQLDRLTIGDIGWELMKELGDRG